ncbi:MAG: hypothetical protein ACREPQ_14600 [Rhodanobacter sp.]
MKLLRLFTNVLAVLSAICFLVAATIVLIGGDGRTVMILGAVGIWTIFLTLGASILDDHLIEREQNIRRNRMRLPR